MNASRREPGRAALPGARLPQHRPEAAAEQAVIVEIDQDGAVRIRECPPGVVVMVVDRQVVESGERSEQDSSPAPPEQRKRSIGAGRREGTQPEQHQQSSTDTGVREIPVEFPG